jgi:hypothetical protein
MMNSSKPCGPSGSPQAPSAKRRRARLRVSCSPSPRPSPSGYLFSVLPASCRRKGKQPHKGNNHWPNRLTAMPCQRDAGSTLNTYPSGEGEKSARAVIIRRNLVVVCLRNERQRSEDCNRNVRVFQCRPSALPPGGRAGVRGNEANSDPKRTTIPGTFKLRESTGRTGGFPS